MADPQQIIDNIRAALSAPEPSAALSDLASAYARLCAQANTRLRRCVDYLRQGMRCEAVELAETPPNLLETITTLDFPQRKAWDALCGKLRLPLGPPLRFEAAHELNESYVADIALRDLLSRHRRLALGRGSLIQRIAVLRELAEQDSGNLRWRLDLAELRRARLAQIGALAIAAAADHNIPAAAQLLDELDNDDDGCTGPLADDLRQRLGQQVRRHLAQQAAVQLDALIAPLEEAYRQGQLERAVELRAQWLTGQQNAAGEIPDALAARAQAALDWISLQLQEQQRLHDFQQACAMLRGAIGTRAPIEELQRLHDAAAAMQLPWPEGLSAQYSAAIRRQRRDRQIARWRNVGIGVGLALAFAGLATWLIIRDLHQQREKYWQPQLQSALDAGDWQQGQSDWEKMRGDASYLIDSPAFQAIKSRLDELAATDRQRADEFNAAMSRAEAAGLDKPDDADLIAADAKARTPSEKTRLENLRDKIAAAQLKRRDQLLAQFRDSLAALQANVADLNDALLAGDPVDFGRRLTADQQSLQSLRGHAAQVGAGAAREELQKLADRLAQAKDQLAQTSAERTALIRLNETPSSAATLAPALKDFAAQFPQSQHAKDFSAAAAFAPSWEALEAWSALWSAWAQNPIPESPEQAARRATQLADFLRQHPVWPLSIDARNYLEFLSQAAQPDSTWQKNIADFLQNPLIADIDALPTIHGTYYLKGGTKILHGSLGSSFPAILGNDVSKTKDVTLKEEELTDKPGPSPQTMLAKAIGQQLQKPAADDGHNPAMSIAQMVRDQKDLDPVLRVVMLEQVFKAAQTAAWGWDRVLRAPLAKLADLHDGDVVWVNPTDPAAQAARPAAQAAVAELPALADLQTQVAQQRKQMFDALPFVVAGEGTLFKTSAGARLQTQLAPAEGQEALVVTGVDPAQPELLSMGKVRGGKWTLDDQKLRIVPDGSLVFIRAAH